VTDSANDRLVVDQHGHSRGGTLSRRELLGGTGKVALGLGLSPLAVSAIAGCGTSSSSSASPRSSRSVGGTVRFALSDGGPQDTIDPPKMSISVFANLATIALYDNILVGNDATLQPTRQGIVTDWEISKDLMTWTLDIRKGVEFHDGTKMTAKDVAYSIQTQVAPNGPSPNSATAGVFLSPSGVTVLDPYTVRLTLNKPNSFFYVYLQNRFMRVIKDGAPAVTTNHIGTGPFVFKSFVPGQSFVATRNPNYWQEGKPYLDSLQLQQIPEPSAQYQALEAGQVDMMEELTPALAKTLSASASNTVLALPNDEWYFMIMDPRKNPVFRNTKLIQAVKASVNRQQIINDVFSGYAQLGYDEPIASADAFFDSQLKLPEQDLTQARALLREAGYPNGVNIGQLNTAAITGAAIDFAVAIQQQLAAVNIHCTIKETPAATYYDNIWLKEPLYVSYNLRRTPAEIFKTFYGPTAPYPESGLVSPQLEAAVNDAFGTTDFARQKADFAIAESICYNQDTRLLPLFADGLYGINRKVQDVRPSPLNIVSFTDAYWT
jgi:peptide/nickel transport system substrate-binding protein